MTLSEFTEKMNDKLIAFKLKMENDELQDLEEEEWFEQFEWFLSESE